LPVAVAFARSGCPVVGFDNNEARTHELSNGIDRTNEVAPAELVNPNLSCTSNPDDLRQADFHIIAVPTPVTDIHRPDLQALLSASRIVGERLKHGDIIVYESTVYPGATENECVPVLEGKSGLKSGFDFSVGYSPERLNPGDPAHRFESIAKVVSAQDSKTLDIVASVYSSVVTAGVYRAPNIATAEAAKVIENTQRDLNIALMNELALIFARLGLDTQDVLEAASTKWNFLRFSPGLVGGHCIGVDPYYLTHRAEEVGYQSEVILAGRRINDGMGSWVARETIKRLMRKPVNGRLSITLLGITFKENVPDHRNSRVVDIVRELMDFGIRVEVHDPLADPEKIEKEYSIPLLTLEDMQPADAVILAVPHDAYRRQGWTLVTSRLKNGEGLVVDVRACLDRRTKPAGISLWRL
jgi:UDP-N-acetyl-D-glucosamine/UDP-N-acetyl-D-galactosamine dehydrogenase